MVMDVKMKMGKMMKIYTRAHRKLGFNQSKVKFFFFFQIAVQLIYNVMLVSMTQMNLSTKQKQTNRESFIPKCHFSGDIARISELPSPSCSASCPVMKPRQSLEELDLFLWHSTFFPCTSVNSWSSRQCICQKQVASKMETYIGHKKTCLSTWSYDF